MNRFPEVDGDENKFRNIVWKAWSLLPNVTMLRIYISKVFLENLLEA